MPQARGWFFSQKSQRAFAEGRTAEGLLYLANAYDFDPANYALGLTLAKSYQSGQPHASDLVFERLLREHPAQRNFTLQEWFRALLARGDFEKITTIARAEVLADPAQANVWMRALLFATRQTGDEAALRELLANPSPGAVQWHQLLETELLIRAGLAPEARAALDRDWPVRAPAFTLFYRVSALTALGDTYAAVDVLERNALPMGLDGDTHDTLLLDAYAAAGADRPLQHELDRLLTARLTLQKITVLCTHLIRHPSAETFGRLCDKVRVDGIRFDNDSSGVWFSLVCTAGAVGETTRLHALVLSLKQAVKSRFRTLDAVESFFRGESAAMRITTFLPVLPLPLEIDYALIDRYPGPVRPPPADADKST